ncbi:hypothetical protein [Pedobacter sp. SL55]|uniref:hypothetical protein n=1 Tax=Pedobacter sp. SL55 TaxID=2995161 RepID=UPI00226F71AA|nr:hypothetical protein [Pedobacter sp. SL55]WAC39045.1 hypothetical protein OVA16_10495 [Pedobacter sp. SL55]
MKHAFTPGGAAKVLANLYALTDSALAIEAQAFSNDLKNWLHQHFELNSHQTLYLAQLNPEATGFYATQGAFALQNRLPIYLEVGEHESQDGEEGGNNQGKIIYTKGSATAVTDGQGQLFAEGELYYCIRY